MQLINGLIAFATLMAIGTVWAHISDITTAAPNTIWVFTFLYFTTSLLTSSETLFPRRFLYLFITATLFQPATKALGLLFESALHYHITPAPILYLLAICNAAYCLKTIRECLPQSLKIQPGRANTRTFQRANDELAESLSSVAMSEKDLSGPRRYRQAQLRAAQLRRPFSL